LLNDLILNQIEVNVLPNNSARITLLEYSQILQSAAYIRG